MGGRHRTGAVLMDRLGAHKINRLYEGPGLPEVHHIGLVVADLDRTLQTWQRSSGFGPAYVTDAKMPTARLPNGLSLDGERLAGVSSAT